MCPPTKGIEAYKRGAPTALTPPSGVTPCGSQKLAFRSPASPGSPRQLGGRGGGIGGAESA